MEKTSVITLARRKMKFLKIVAVPKFQNARRGPGTRVENLKYLLSSEKQNEKFLINFFKSRESRFAFARRKKGQNWAAGIFFVPFPLSDGALMVFYFKNFRSAFKKTRFSKTRFPGNRVSRKPRRRENT